ncbi:pyridine nucleotide-disulfide oxidoreductase [Mobiluncus mulieris 28-1]|uniref:Pyridine nucleotide-disulfide oxidoreductase n=2 Tax=Mobiluncus mulieris TaxID=2052 RepID=E0QRF0_9ACTO|nr:FAD-dependent oxidoreductase [Mobiluncus mulieris]EEJ54426.1 pyridine nucleotide-disulfide oxidoreductase [Mobiluncus mulieris ATCC 35243]EEZ91976.1 pyridine nucleotide-disulfide oxidoreductase [Mobiluncus mulieris 28-1]EFM45658.1 pyridine nucleotide-disulfide oxidoreductase [Mobiluncus mulieris ATCC 35239]EFN93355.1 pyridine nucleotide-disulfide oxidoreductase [Mobiluncus mulieris FB024-16]MBB5846165.1 NADH dehydrogenase FAD-containing subunit [Mobiluncus mulieris]
MVRVTVVGGGYGGITVAGGLDDVAEVTLVEQKDQFVHHAAALRAVVDDIWAHTIFMPYSRLLKNGQVIQDKATKVEGTTVHLATHEPVTADYLVLATGSTYPYPAKQDQPNAADAKARLEETRDNLSRARRVLLVGAGTVGIEFAGELTSNFPDVEVVMVDRAPHILGSNEYAPQLRDVLTQELEESGVRLVLGSPLSFVPPTEPGVYQPFHVETQDGVGIDADIWFLCYGAQTASGYLQSTHADRLNEEGQLAVDEYLRVKGSENVYAVGDLTDVPESKRADAARAHARVVVANIKAAIAGKAPSTVYTPGKMWVVLPLGMEGGASQLTGEDGEPRIVGPEETAEIKGNDLMVTMVRGQLHLP